MSNLLDNPGFEGGWWRRTATGQEFGEIFVPQGWVGFWKEGGPVPHDPGNPNGYGRPEMHVINREPPFLDPLRVRSGQRALKFFTFFRIHDAGLYQQVTGITPGTRLEATGWAHAWSSTKDNSRYSDGAGTAPYFIRASEYQRDPDAPATGIRNFTFKVGIDPEGGVDPWSDRIVWGEGAHIYNAFAQIPPVEAVAAADTVTVFVHSTVLWPFKHCDAYIDDMRLTATAPTAAPLGITLTPDRVMVGQPFEVSATGGLGAEHLTISFSDDRIFQKPTRIVNGRAVCQSVAVGLGEYEVRVTSDTGQVGALVFDVAAQPAPVIVPEPEPEPEPEEPAPSGYVMPREQYERTYVLLPPGTGDAWFQAVSASGIWARRRWTVGGSADDAGIGPAKRRVIAVNPHAWPSDLGVFFETYYAGLEYLPLVVATAAELTQILRRL